MHLDPTKAPPRDRRIGSWMRQASGRIGLDTSRRFGDRLQEVLKGLLTIRREVELKQSDGLDLARRWFGGSSETERSVFRQRGGCDLSASEQPFGRDALRVWLPCSSRSRQCRPFGCGVRPRPPRRAPGQRPPESHRLMWVGDANYSVVGIQPSQSNSEHRSAHSHQ